MKITKEWLEEKRACEEGIEWFLNQSETDAGKILLKLIDEDRRLETEWLLGKVIKTKEQAVKIAIFSAELVIDIFEDKYPEEKRPRLAIDAAKVYLKNPCKQTKVAARAAHVAAYAAAYTAADIAAYVAAYVADAADAATYAAAHAAAYIAGAADAAAYRKIVEYAIKEIGL